jgi:hypothetical protein
MKNTCTILLIVIFCCSCNKNTKITAADISVVFQYEKSINVDFKNNTIEVLYRGLKYKDTFNLTRQDSIKLSGSITKNRIIELEGNYSYPQCAWLMPSLEDKIEIYKGGKILNTIKINYQPNCTDSKKTIELENKNKTFGNDIRNLLLNKSAFKRALDTLKEFRERKKGLF